MENKKMNYEKQANDFLRYTGAEIKIRFLKKDKYFHDDKEARNIYTFTISRGKRKYKGTFGDSIYNTKEGIVPSEYDILACLTKYEPEETIKDFMSAYGYEDEKTAKKIYNEVKKEYQGMKMLFNDKELEILQEIN
jgi:hypothetical protein